MAPTSEERREVAARLRSAAKTYSGSPDYLWNHLEIAVNGWRFGDVIDDSYVFYNGVLERLADLIDPQERTCHNSAPHYLRFHCSECHYVIYHDDANETGEPEEDGINFCPNCGARVVSEHEE